MKIDINKKYRTRDGREVRLLHRAPEGWPTSYPWRGIVGDASRLTWTDHGVQDLDDSPNDDDLIEVREPREWQISVVTEEVFEKTYRIGYPIGSVSSYQNGDDEQGYEVIRVREIID